jgi:hypothetical protein
LFKAKKPKDKPRSSGLASLEPAAVADSLGTIPVPVTSIATTDQQVCCFFVLKTLYFHKFTILQFIILLQYYKQVSRCWRRQSGFPLRPEA